MATAREHLSRTGTGRFALRWLAACRDIVLPPACAACGCDLEATPAAGLLCPACIQKIAPALPAQCPKCAAPLPEVMQDATDCTSCRRDRWKFTGTIALGPYTGELRGAILTMKGPTGEPLAAALAGLLHARNAEKLADDRFDGIVPVPSHPLRRMTGRGESAAVLAHELARRMGVKSWPLLTRTRFIPRQSTLPPTRRRLNQRRSMRASWRYRLKGARLLLVDDVMTTGATAKEAARVLHEAGAEFVSLAVIARGIGAMA